MKPLRVGVVFSGGPASGGHNVVAGLFDALLEMDSSSKLIGFLNGPRGIVEGNGRVLTKGEIDSFRNQGGFDLLGSGRDKIETNEQMEKALAHAQDLDGLVIIGGDDSNTNGAILAEFFRRKQGKTSVIGVPKTIDGDLRSDAIEISFGYDTATKTYAETIGNIGKDALSSRKYYHFIKLMGRSASHVALECALLTQPNLTLIGEEGRGLFSIVSQIASMVIERSKQKKEYGLILLPEGLTLFLPEMKQLIEALSKQGELSFEMKQFFNQLPPSFQKQLQLDKDPHGNIKVSQIDIQDLLIAMTQKELQRRGFEGPFAAQSHFLGYEGRAAFPTHFDATYAYTLGRMSALAIQNRLTGMIATVQHLKKPLSEWTLQMVPLVEMIHFEERKGVQKPVIEKALVDQKSPAFVYYLKNRSLWEKEDQYLSPGPIQWFGPPMLTQGAPMSLCL